MGRMAMGVAELVADRGRARTHAMSAIAARRARSQQQRYSCRSTCITKFSIIYPDIRYV